MAASAKKVRYPTDIPAITFSALSQRAWIRYPRRLVGKKAAVSSIAAVHRPHAENRSRWANVHAANHVVARRSERSGTMIFLIRGP
jgi:hypothetical protein